MLRSDERWIIHMEAQVSWVPHIAPLTMTIAELEQILAPIPGTSAASQRVNALSGDEYVTLDSVKYWPTDKSPKALILLLSCTNKLGADPGFRNVVNGANRTEAKKADEGLSSSAHLVIGLNEVAGSHGSYWPALLEDVPNIGKTKIQHALTTMIGLRAKFSFDNNGTKESASARFQLHSQEGEDLINDIGSGELKYFVATRERKPSIKFDGISGLEPQEQTQKFKIEKNFKPDDGIKSFLTKIIKASRSAGYGKVRLQYVRQDGKNRSLTLGTHREDSEDFLIKKVEKIDVSGSPLPQMHKDISSTLVKEMIKRLPKP